MGRGVSFEITLQYYNTKVLSHKRILSNHNTENDEKSITIAPIPLSVDIRSLGAG